MPFQAVAQRERVDQAIRRNLPVLHHLRLDLTLAVLREQGVEHHEAESPRDVSRRKMRIERGDFRFQHRDKIAAGIGRHNRRSRDQCERKYRADESLQFEHGYLFRFVRKVWEDLETDNASREQLLSQAMSMPQLMSQRLPAVHLIACAVIET